MLPPRGVVCLCEFDMEVMVCRDRHNRGWGIRRGSCSGVVCGGRHDEEEEEEKRRSAMKIRFRSNLILIPYRNCMINE